MRARNNLPQPNPYILVLGCGRLLDAPRSAFFYLQFMARCHPYILLYFIIIYTGDIDSGVTLTVYPDLNGASPQFTRICISTGGSATTVSWTRDSVTVTEGTETVLNDPVNAHYTHTLTETRKLGELIACTMTNDKAQHPCLSKSKHSR